MLLSQNFSLTEFAVSADWPQLAANISFTPVEIERLRFACCSILEPLRSHFRQPVRITSGKRAPDLNRAVGGHPRSHHLFAGDTGAADICIAGIEPLIIAEWLVENTTLEYVIAYTERRFVHISFPVSSPPPNKLHIRKES